jgi:hypothetical protein
MVERTVARFGSYYLVFDGIYFWVKKGLEYITGVQCKDHHFAFRVAHGAARRYVREDTFKSGGTVCRISIVSSKKGEEK